MIIMPFYPNNQCKSFFSISTRIKRFIFSIRMVTVPYVVGGHESEKNWHRSKFSIIVIAASSASFLVMLLSLLASTSKKISVKFSKPYCSSVSKQSDLWISSMVTPSLLRSHALNVASIKSTSQTFMKKKY